MSTPIAIGFGDLHLTLTPPACRAETDWLAVQAGYLKQVKDLARELGDVPVLFAGDLFDKWDPKPELIHFALEHLPDGMICVPGQHDLPNHRIEDMNRSGYGVLARAGKIFNISGTSTHMRTFDIYGYGWGENIIPAKKALKDMIRIALVHKYLWAGNKKFNEAPETSHVKRQREFTSYDFVVSGDNHQPFREDIGGCIVLNQGTFIRRKSDEIPLRPRIAILRDDKTFDFHYLDTSKDRFHENAKEREEVALDLKQFIDDLEKLGEQGLDFRQSVKQHLEKERLPKQTEEIIRRAIE